MMFIHSLIASCRPSAVHPRAVYTAFSDLLSRKKYQKITIQDIIDEADIGRSTFYSHFETKDELLREMCLEIFDHVFSETLATEQTHDFSISEDKTRTAIMHILYHLRDSKNNISGLFTSESGAIFMNYFKLQIEQLVCPHLIENPSLKRPEVPAEFLINHITSSFVGMVSWWMHRGMPESPETLTRYFVDVIIT